MSPRRTPTAPSAADYRDDETRLNNPPAGLADVSPLSLARRRYEYDPRLDPQLQRAGSVVSSKRQSSSKDRYSASPPI